MRARPNVIKSTLVRNDFNDVDVKVHRRVLREMSAARVKENDEEPYCEGDLAEFGRLGHERVRQKAYNNEEKWCPGCNHDPESVGSLFGCPGSGEEAACVPLVCCRTAVWSASNRS